MSYQTKKQSIGYILRATLDAGSNTTDMKELYYKLDEAINQHISVNGGHETIDNYSTYDFMVFINRELGQDDEYIQKVGSALYYCYDVYTVGEAETFYDGFKHILRV